MFVVAIDNTSTKGSKNLQTTAELSTVLHCVLVERREASLFFQSFVILSEAKCFIPSDHIINVRKVSKFLKKWQ